MTTWMCYGANGYTGGLIAEEAKKRGLQPVLAGRNRQALEALGRELDMEVRVFSLADMAQNLAGVDAVLLAAGPFCYTSALAVDACLQAGVHYLDITGEIDVFENLHKRDAEAKEHGCVLLPGVGFDVVPTDCLAATLSAAMPDAVDLQLAFSGGQLSKGTTKTMLAHVGDGGALRKDGVIERVALAFETKDIQFYDKMRHSMLIPWGDVATAYHSTGIPNIRVYTGANKSRVRQMKSMRYVAPLLTSAFVQKQLGKLIDSNVRGPDAKQRQAMKAELWGQVSDAAGKTLQATLTTPEAYRLTAATAVVAVERVSSVEPGFQTPSSAFGASFITEFDDCTLREPSSVTAQGQSMQGQPTPSA